MTTTDTTVSNLIINKLTQAQYETITPSDTELYLTTDGVISSSDITTALGYTPYSASNPNGYISSAALNDLTDVTISNPTAGQNLTYDATNQVWKNTSTSATIAWGGITGTLSDQTDLKNALDGKQPTSTAVTHTASTAVGSATQPVYIASDGTATATTYSLAKSVPSDAVFTDTTYTQGTGISISNGTISVASPTLTNTATGSGSLTIDGNPSTGIQCINIGSNSTSNNANSIVIGRDSRTQGNNCLAFGFQSVCGTHSCIQIGKGTNTEQDTMCVGFTWADKNWKLLDGTTGLIPTDRISVMTGADGTNAGAKGLAPAPTATDNTKFLKGDGTWANVPEGTVTSVNNVSPVSGNVTLSIPTKISDLTDDTSTYPIDQADVLTNQRTGVVKLWTGTLAQYNAITTKDANTLYNITDDTPSAQGVALAMPDYSNGQSISLNVWTWRTVTKNVYLAIGYAGQTDYPSILLKDDKGNMVTTPYGYSIIIACTINYYTTGIFLPKGYSYQWSTIQGGGACNVTEYPLKGVIS